MGDDVGQLITAHSWMGRDEKPSSALQKRLISYALKIFLYLYDLKY